MKVVTKVIYLLGGALIAVSCGDSGKDGSDKSYSQDVRNIGFTVRELDLNTQFSYDKGAREELIKTLRFDENSSKDQIRRIIQNENFVLLVNDKNAAVTLSSSGKIEHIQSVEEKSPGCELVGTSSITGEATNLNLNLEWRLNAELKGDTCNEVMQAKYLAFQNQEVDSLNLSSVRDLIQASDKQRELSRKITIYLRVSGDGN